MKRHLFELSCVVIMLAMAITTWLHRHPISADEAAILYIGLALMWGLVLFNRIELERARRMLQRLHEELLGYKLGP